MIGAYGIKMSECVTLSPHGEARWYVGKYAEYPFNIKSISR